MEGLSTLKFKVVCVAVKKKLCSGTASVVMVPLLPLLADTVMVAVADAAEVCAVIVAEPAALAVTTPEELTVATLVLELVQVTSLCAGEVDNCIVFPTTTLEEEGEIVKLVST